LKEVNMQRLRCALLVSLAVVWIGSFAAVAVQMRPGARGGHDDKRHDRGKATAVDVALAFSERDQQLIRSYFAGGGRGLPPGLAKRGGNLPPGLEKHLQRNGTLPPGLQKRVQPFPVELTRQLPALPSGCSRVILEGRALILDRNNKILDLMAVVR
jgi:hypothetical protein